MVRALLMSALCAACTAPVGSMPPRERVPVATAPEIGRQQLAAAVLIEANRARAAAGARELAREPGLERAAMKYAAELAALRRLSHESSTRGMETLRQRVDAEGVSWKSIGENLASISGSNVTVPERTMRVWLDSPGHRANLLNGDFTQSGVGVATDMHGTWYVVQIYLLGRR